MEPETVEDKPELTFEEADASTPEEKLPEWAAVPEDLKIPPGRSVFFVRFKAEWTLNKTGHDRVLILWPITVREEKLAIKRARGEVGEIMDELTKAAVRCVDGKPIKPDMASQILGKLWDELGLKCVSQLRNWYQRQHTLEPEQAVDFYGSCVAVTSSVATE